MSEQPKAIIPQSPIEVIKGVLVNSSAVMPCEEFEVEIIAGRIIEAFEENDIDLVWQPVKDVVAESDQRVIDAKTLERITDHAVLGGADPILVKRVRVIIDPETQDVASE